MNPTARAGTGQPLGVRSTAEPMNGSMPGVCRSNAREVDLSAGSSWQTQKLRLSRISGLSTWPFCTATMIMGGCCEHCCTQRTDTPARRSAKAEVRTNDPAGMRSRTGATVGRSAGTQSMAFLFRGFTGSQTFLAACFRQGPAPRGNRRERLKCAPELERVHKPLFQGGLRSSSPESSRTTKKN